MRGLPERGRPETASKRTLPPPTRGHVRQPDRQPLRAARKQTFQRSAKGQLCRLPERVSSRAGMIEVVCGASPSPQRSGFTAALMPVPTPLSAMNSTPSASSATWMSRRVRSCGTVVSVSIRAMVRFATPVISATRSCDRLSQARAARSREDPDGRRLYRHLPVQLHRQSHPQAATRKRAHQGQGSRHHPDGDMARDPPGAA